jgi:hypothetical protein
MDLATHLGTPLEEPVAPIIRVEDSSKILEPVY